MMSAQMRNPHAFLHVVAITSLLVVACSGDDSTSSQTPSTAAGAGGTAGTTSTTAGGGFADDGSFSTGGASGAGGGVVTSDGAPSNDRDAANDAATTGDGTARNDGDAAKDVAAPKDSAMVDATSPSDAAVNGWTGTWAASPQNCADTYNQQTLRQIVHTSMAGTVARVQISNAFGNRSITVSDLHIARRTTGSSVDSTTDKAVTFGGQTSATIPAATSAMSDPVAFPVAAQSDVAISFYLPQSTGPATCHQLGLQTNYIASGDVSGSATLAGAKTTNSYFFLANLDVQSATSEGAVVALGASITDGAGSPDDTNHRWPNYLAARLVAAGRQIGVLNQGISGNRLVADGSGQSALNRFDRDVLAQPDVRWVIFSDDPINDLGSANPPSSDQLITGLTQLVTRAHQKGLKFLCSTLTPFEGAGYWTPTGETGREAINAFIKGPNSGCDGIVDQDTATHDPAHPTRYLPAYDSGDHLHPNDAGMQAIAKAVDLTLFMPR
jgi:lysophospholipase L1-like esterase